MIKSLKKEWNYTSENVTAYLLVPLVCWIIGEIITASIMVFAKAVTFFSIGSILASIALLIMSIISVVYYYFTGMDLAICMCRTRKKYIIGIFVSEFLHLIIGILEILVLSQISELIRNIFFKNIELEGEFYGVLKLDYIFRNSLNILAIVFGILLLGMVVGAMVKKFGAKATWVIWTIYMIVILFGDKISKMFSVHEQNSLLGSLIYKIGNLFGGFPTWFFPVILILVIVGIVCYSINILLKVSVR